MTDKEKELISFLTVNQYSYRDLNDSIAFWVYDEGEKVEVYFNKNENGYYIEQSYNFEKNVPHIIEAWRCELDGKDMFGLCLTLDNTLRDTSFSVSEEIRRVKQIVFEKWNNPIDERFKELEVMLQPVKRNSHIYFEDREYSTLGLDYDSFHSQTPRTLEQISISFEGQRRNQIDSIVSKKSVHASGLVLFRNMRKTKRFYFEKKDGRIKYYKIEDYSDNVIFARTGKLRELDQFDNIAIIGLGSVGAAITEYLVKNGVKNIHAYDDEQMHAHNTPRHAVGYNPFIDSSKTEQLKAHLMSIMPFAKISFYNQKFSIDKEILKGKTLIINTTGGAIRTMFGRFASLYGQLIKGSCYLDVFVEPFGAAVHFVSMSTDEDGTRKSLDTFNNIDWEKRMIADPQKDFRDNFQGCFVSTLPYGYGCIQVAVPLIFCQIERKGFELGHFTIPMIELSGVKEHQLNKNCELKFNRRRVGVHKWK